METLKGSHTLPRWYAAGRAGGLPTRVHIEQDHSFALAGQGVRLCRERHDYQAIATEVEALLARCQRRNRDAGAGQSSTQRAPPGTLTAA